MHFAQGTAHADWQIGSCSVLLSSPAVCTELWVVFLMLGRGAVSMLKHRPS